MLDKHKSKMGYVDICLPVNNEEKLAEQAKKIGYTEVVFLYEFKHKQEIEVKKKELKFVEKKLEVKIHTGTLISLKKPANLRLARALYLESDLIAAKSSGFEKITRAILSQKRIDITCGIATVLGRDYVYGARSGLNQVLARLAAKSGQAYGIDFSEILHEKERKKLLRRITHNVKICQSCKVPIVLASFASDPSDMRWPQDLVAFAEVLGIKEPKKVVGENIITVLRRKAELRSPAFVRPGVKIVS